ncbi:GMC oxidoreductase-domain-containing protein [Gilbertella persicaria]|uniref:GMC oxidoreductase-domain-containing protein n=1 Tax=Gilbertella persicaria TaxID=101096 RepID=UPI00221EBA7F|nr:GMC oxidoreductase-domain-containing protein [Gilbertella persicaria]KAI8098251.1 GMC oxidoreductase-domain-containing protein [Gilbertella persicaria]
MMPSNMPFVLNKSQIEMLSAIFDTFIAPLSPTEQHAIEQKLQASGISPKHISTMSHVSATSLRLTPVVIQFIQDVVPPTKQKELVRILDMLATRPGALLLTGHWQPLTELDREKREQVLLGWQKSSFLTFRTLYKAFASLCLFHAYNRKNSVLNECLNYHASRDIFFEQHQDYSTIEHERLPMMTTEEALQGHLSFDVVVVGSGAGGGVVAAELSKAGYSVLVIEKGKYYHQSEMVPNEEEAYKNMYDTGTAMTSRNNSIECLSGATLGGGTAVNYLVSLKPQHFVREEWILQGLSHFNSPQFSKDLDYVFDRIGASQENILETLTNQKFEKGCRDLGYPIEKVYVNTGGKPHHCSRCMYGCRSGIKHSTANSWLKDAHQYGARFLDRTQVTRVLTKNQKVVGVECVVHRTQKTTIQATRVIVACGALRTPSLLWASGLKNPHIGRHLVLQPILFGFGLFDEPIRQKDGPLISRVSDGGDVKIEEGLVLPGGLATKLPWLGAARHKELMLRHDHILSLINVVRDTDSIGTVIHDPENPNPVFDYVLSKLDQQVMITSLERNMKLMVAAGARELYTLQPNVEPFVFSPEENIRVDHPRFEHWLESVRKAGISSISTPLVSVHQLGSW